jgi:hypothetical protein
MDTNFALHYFTRYKSLPPFFRDGPDAGLGMVVIIPCLDDAFVFNTLDSLENAGAIRAGIEVIVNVNSGETAPADVVERNRTIFDGLQQRAATGFYRNFQLLPLLVEETAKKKAGVGHARKTAMDEAVRRFTATGRPDGLIVSLDADTLVAGDYFQVIEQASRMSQAACFTFQFRHDYDAGRYPGDILNACRLYETYLRYYRLSLKTFDSPFAIHTIGSCFAVRAGAYARLGGMSARQGGEDFYFLQKAVKMHPVHEVMHQIVYPSPRVSARVPFGTGPSVRSILEQGRYTVYNFELFRLLKTFYDLFPAMERGDVTGRIPAEIMTFVGDRQFGDMLSECRSYSGSSGTFVKRMYDKFDAFFIVKFLNTFNDSCIFPPVDVTEAGRILLEYYGVRETDDLYEAITKLDVSTV